MPSFLCHTPKIVLGVLMDEFCSSSSFFSVLCSPVWENSIPLQLPILFKDTSYAPYLPSPNWLQDFTPGLLRYSGPFDYHFEDFFVYLMLHGFSDQAISFLSGGFPPTFYL